MLIGAVQVHGCGHSFGVQVVPCRDQHHVDLIERHAGVDSVTTARGAEALVLHAVLSLQAALGELSESVSGALHAESPGGIKLTNHEKHEIHEALDAIHNQAEAIKRMMAE